MKHFHLVNAPWPEDSKRVHAIRQQVFIIEQGIAPELELTGDDDQFKSNLALDEDQKPIGTGRIKVSAGNATIGRMAVLKQWRGTGVGSAILNRLQASLGSGLVFGFECVTHAVIQRYTAFHNSICPR